MTYAAELAKLSPKDFFAVIDRNFRNEDLAFADICKLRSNDELLDTLHYWKSKEGRYAEHKAAIVKAEIMDRFNVVDRMRSQI